MRGFRPQIVALATACILTGSAAHADTIAVTGGGLDISGFPGGLIHDGLLQIAGDRGFTLSAGVSSLDGAYDPTTSCSPGCSPGDPLSVGAVWLGLSLQDASATYEGISYPNVADLNEPTAVGVQFEGVLNLPSMLTPSATVQTPFLLGGLFYDGATRHTLFGRGLATVFLETVTIQDFDSMWAVRRVHYALSNDPGAPIPEPSTLLLIGSGVGGLILRSRRRTRLARDPESTLGR